MKSIVEQYNEYRHPEVAESDPPAIPVLGRLSRSPVEHLARSYRDYAPAVMLVSHSRFAAGYVLDRFLATIEADKTVISVEQSFAEPVAFMEQIVSATGFGARATSLSHLEHAFGLFLRYQKACGARTVLAIPDIDALGDRVLARVRDLIDQESANQFGLMVVATRPPGDVTLPVDPMLESISSRFAIRIVLTPFVLSETREFILERFERPLANGVRDKAVAPQFDVYATQLIHELCSGVPETVHLLCRKPVAAAARNDDATVSTAAVKAAAILLGLMPEPSDMQQQQPLPANVSQGDAPGRLIVKVPGVPEQAIMLNGSHVLIGRDRLCDICVEDTHVSRLHGLIARAADGLYYLDLGSTNGSAVNGETTRRLELANNDVIAVGDVRIIYSLKEGIVEADIDLDATDTFEIPDFRKLSPGRVAGNGSKVPRKR
jgi:type II secretory pathway predicted ATPase ExeA